ncbi:MAG: polysaccharide deacetylase family protein [Sulfurovum sp.]|nr:polysaccharide deacetylase family protein [Sulfurovum sp.]NNJ46159.1 polysaccharide deacetylase family protein [Sulfurovum sp.]
MKHVSFIVLLIGVLGYLGYEVYYHQYNLEESINNEIKVLLIYNRDKNSDILKAYESVLEEEGVPFEIMSNSTLIKIPPDTISMNIPAIIFPDSVNQYIKNSTDYWIEKYVKSGGKVALIYDVDTRGKDGKYKLSPTYLDRVLGLNFSVYQEERDQSYQYGNIYFKDQEAVNYFEMPTGKIDENFAIVGYQYGKLLYPLASVRVINDEGQKVYATDEKKRSVIVQKDIEKGSLLYVNTPLGALKGKSDDLLLRSILKTFLFKIAHVPHLISSPNAKGTLVINWHIDSSIEHASIKWNIENNYFRKDINQTFHITSGPDVYIPQDGLGFDVLGEGRGLVEQLMEYGSIGSHGGWIHNWFAKNIKEKNLTTEEIKSYIQNNNEALEAVTGYKPIEYSAPVGVFPPLSSIKIMKELGFKSYYYVGDSGSAPNRTFYNGKMLSDTIIAFPVMTFGINASLKEAHDSHLSEEKMKKYYREFADYLVANRSVRLFYSHPHDIRDYQYQDAVKDFLDYISTLVEEGKLQTRTMTNISHFIVRLANTKKRFTVDAEGIYAEVTNDISLDEIVLAIPKNVGQEKIKKDDYLEDENYYYIPLNGNDNRALINFPVESLLKNRKQDIRKG